MGRYIRRAQGSLIDPIFSDFLIIDEYLWQTSLVKMEQHKVLQTGFLFFLQGSYVGKIRWGISFSPHFFFILYFWTFILIIQSSYLPHSLIPKVLGLETDPMGSTWSKKPPFLLFPTFRAGKVAAAAEDISRPVRSAAEAERMCKAGRTGRREEEWVSLFHSCGWEKGNAINHHSPPK